MPPIKEHYVVKHLKTGKYGVKWVLKGVRPYWKEYKVLKGGPYDEATANTIVAQAMKLKTGKRTAKAQDAQSSVRTSREAKRREEELKLAYKDAKQWWEALKPVVRERYAAKYYRRARNLSKERILELYQKHKHDW